MNTIRLIVSILLVIIVLDLLCVTYSTQFWFFQITRHAEAPTSRNISTHEGIFSSVFIMSSFSAVFHNILECSVGVRLPLPGGPLCPQVSLLLDCVRSIECLGECPQWTLIGSNSQGPPIRGLGCWLMYHTTNLSSTIFLMQLQLGRGGIEPKVASSQSSALPLIEN